MTLVLRRFWPALSLAAALAASGCAFPAHWTTYRGDAQRSGLDGTSGAATGFSQAWTSPTLAGPVYAQPLIYFGLVIVATENNDVYALNETTGGVIWHAKAGVPVPAGQLPCGNIWPTVGITSTPVIDPVSGRVFVVADTWNGSSSSSIAHRLFAFNLGTGTPVAGFPINVDPPGSIPPNQLQRTALALTGGKVVIGYGGNDGDCGTYNGWLASVPKTGGALRTFKVEPGDTGGAIWGSGDGPAVDSAQNLWVATGNGFGSGYGYQESVLKLDSNLNLLDHWAPSNWAQLDNSDTDLGSSEPLLLPGGLVFQIGKSGIGHLLSATHLGGTGAAPRYQAQVCGQTSDASFGGAIYYAGVIYVSCADGLRALSLNVSSARFSALAGWQVTSSAIGPPIVSAGRVWVTDWSGDRLYGLQPKTGQVLVNQGTPGMQHFTAPAAAEGKLFLATGQTVEAYRVAKPVSFAADTAVKTSMAVGQTRRLAFRLRPKAAVTLSRVSVTAVLPRGLEFASRVRVSGSCRRAVVATAARAVKLWAPRLSLRSSCTITVPITATAPGAKTARVVVSSNGQPIARLLGARVNVVRSR